MHSMHISTPRGILRHLMVVMMDKLEAQDFRAEVQTERFFHIFNIKDPHSLFGHLV